LTERRSAGNDPHRRPDRPGDRDRPFPELSRHFRAAEEVYRPDPATWLRPPSSRPSAQGARDGDGRRPAEHPAVPPRNRRKLQAGRSRAASAKFGAALLALVVVAGFGVERMRVATGEPTATPPPTATVPIVAASPTEMPVEVVPATATSTRTPSPTKTPSPTPSPSPTPTPDPRFVGKIVCLDPGHGGSDRGFVRQGNDAAPAMTEAFYNLAFARALRLRLEAHGFTVVMTRTEDVDVNADGRDVNGDGLTAKNQRDPAKAERARLVDEIQARIDVCNAAGADLLVSMHINGFDDPKAEGYETWFSGVRNDADASLLLARIAEEEFGKQYAAAGYNAKSRGVNDDDTANVIDVKHGGFKHYLIIGPAQEGIVPSAMPGAIVEVGFISNDADAVFMSSNAGRNAIVTAYEQAIVRYFATISEEFVYGAK
jgi:N-acetylmuramoyl-L-alanine amidase